MAAPALKIMERQCELWMRCNGPVLLQLLSNSRAISICISSPAARCCENNLTVIPGETRLPFRTRDGRELPTAPPLEIGLCVLGFTLE
jgi:hypothetical protein